MRISFLGLRGVTVLMLALGAGGIGYLSWPGRPVAPVRHDALVSEVPPKPREPEVRAAESPPASIALPAPNWVRERLPALLRQALASGNWEALQAALAEEMQRRPLETVKQLLTAEGLEEMRNSLLLNALEHCPPAQARAVADLVMGTCKDRGQATAALKVLLAATARSDAGTAMGLLPLLGQFPDAAQGVAGLVSAVVQQQGRAGITTLARNLAGSDIRTPALASAVAQLAATDPQGALLAIHELAAPAPSFRSEAALSTAPVLIATGHAGDMAQWLDRLPARSLSDEAWVDLCDLMAGSHPEAAARWAAAIQDETMRHTAETSVQAIASGQKKPPLEIVPASTGLEPQQAPAAVPQTMSARIEP